MAKLKKRAKTKAPRAKKRSVARAKSARPAARARKASAKTSRARRKPAKAKKAVKRSTSAGNSTLRRSKDVIGEGNYTASRKFDKDQTAFVQRNKPMISKLGKEAETALDGPQGNELRQAEDEARSHAHE
jgi:tRNA/tmRNA/rRNA uracil-C5-methylase (TrmA/RlmC/RlmD family)